MMGVGGALLAPGLLAAGVSADDTNAAPHGVAAGGKEAGKDGAKEKSKEPEEKQVVTRHAATIGGKHFDYTATVGTILLRDEAEDKATGVNFLYCVHAG